jgi:hypothetical protein
MFANAESVRFMKYVEARNDTPHLSQLRARRLNRRVELLRRKLGEMRDFLLVLGPRALKRGGLLCGGLFFGGGGLGFGLRVGCECECGVECPKEGRGKSGGKGPRYNAGKRRGK